MQSNNIKVLVACEFSGRVRDAFLDQGIYAMSCDLLPSDSNKGDHHQGDCLELDWSEYDLVIAHPPCTTLCISGNRYYANSQARIEGADIVRRMWHKEGVKRLVIENPVGVINSLIPEMPRPYFIQPWEYGHGETKKTGLWVKGDLPKLTPTCIVDGRVPRIHNIPERKDRWKIRSLTYQGIADAMAKQWGDYLKQQSNNTHNTTNKESPSSDNCK